jgi:hypothetical protein
MSRRIVDFRYASIEKSEIGQQDLDTYFDKVVKFVPTDVVAAWTAVQGIAKPLSNSMILWACFAFGLAFTAAWTWRQASSKTGAKPYVQSIVSTVAFAVWVIAIGPPFDKMISSQVGSLLLIGFTLASGLIYTRQGE